LPETPPRGRDFFGGDLAGVVEHLDHVAALGAGALYLTPIFAAGSNHRYDTIAYDHVDPGLGGDDAFDALVAALRARGIGLVLDAVFNHSGDKHPWMVEATKSPKSAKRRAYHFDEGGRHRAWRGHRHLPEWNLRDPKVEKLLYDGKDSALFRWTRRGATGWRLDCANDLGMRVCARVTDAVHGLGARDGVVGEVMSWAREWLEGGTLDGVMNYVFRAAVISLVRGEIPPQQAAWVLDRVAGEYPREGLLRSWTVLGSHDTPRLSTLLGEDFGRLRLAVTLQYAYPGIPLVYYGDEIGLPGGDDPDNRRPMPWSPERWNQPLLALYRRLGALRAEHPVLHSGGYVPLTQPGEPEVLAFARTDPDPRRTVVCVANPNARRTSARLLLPMSTMPDGMPLVDLLADRRVPSREGFIRLELEQWDVALLIAEPRAIEGYDFYAGLLEK
jgi:glycosidase